MGIGIEKTDVVAAPPTLMAEKDQTVMLNVIQHTVEKHGCHIVVEEQRIEIDGPSEAVSECTHALADFLE